MFTDEEDESSLGAVRYPCMPSLVALQQMRNRLHLAYLGRKLMKWTALATGRELRRIAMEMHSIYDSFAEDLGNAFMLLARGRYFYPNLNKMVLENCPAKASVVVGGRGRMITGVKVMRYEIVESGFEPYEHLGIEKGGQQIHEAKLAWLELLKRMILMQELRNSFMLVEEAHKNATKRHHVLCKVVVPRTNATLAYITNELEEMERENFFRLKKILNIKRKGKDPQCAHTSPVENCASCKIKFKDLEEENCAVCGITLSVFPKIEPIEEEEEFEPEKRLSKLDSNILDAFKGHIADIIEITENMKGKGIGAASVEKFLRTASELRDKLNNKRKSKDSETAEAVEEELQKIASNVSVDKLCDMCIKRYEDEQAAKGAKLDRVREDEAEAKTEAAKLAIKKEDTKQIDLELGVFETEYQQITKIIRVKKEDGTITEERKVIKTKKESKTPIRPPDKDEPQHSGNLMYQASGSSSKSNAYGSGSKTVNMVAVNDRSIFKFKKNVDRKVKSEVLLYVSSLTCPIVRYCMSSASMISASDDFEFCYTTLIENNDDYTEISDITLKEIYASSSELEKTINSFEQSTTPDSSRSERHVHLKTD
ncbi:uncharacterized protein LOC135084996 isoform X2 [Ostrinia nubilalis]|uniref:uncharacterized protein LOC135084996 isoform X2 n=1 Tax=Ostrinia nubilalis TaxID=29057 RepID=UPI00308249E4